MGKGGARGAGARWRHRIGPSDVPGMAAEQAANGQPGPANRSVSRDRLARIARAAWMEPACRGQGGGDEASVGPQQREERPGEDPRQPDRRSRRRMAGANVDLPSIGTGLLRRARRRASLADPGGAADFAGRTRAEPAHEVLPSARNRLAALRSQARSSPTVAFTAEDRATSTRSMAGRSWSSCRAASRRHRFTRLRTTASPTLDDTAIPTRATAGCIPARVNAGCARGDQLAASGPSTKLRPRFFSPRKSPRRSKRALLGNDRVRVPPGGMAVPARAYFFGALTTSRLRPFARRRFRTVRPCLVLIRFRKPCSRLRRTLLGWYVRFTATASTSFAKSAAPKHGRNGVS